MGEVPVLGCEIRTNRLADVITLSSPYITDDMDIQKLLRWIAVVIVLIVAGGVLSLILKVGAAIGRVVLPVLLVLLVIAIILRFIDALRRRR